MHEGKKKKIRERVDEFFKNKSLKTKLTIQTQLQTMNTYNAKKKKKKKRGGMMKRKVSIINYFTVYKMTHPQAS